MMELALVAGVQENLPQGENMGVLFCHSSAVNCVSLDMLPSLLPSAEEVKIGHRVLRAEEVALPLAACSTRRAGLAPNMRSNEELTLVIGGWVMGVNLPRQCEYRRAALTLICYEMIWVQE